MVRQHKIKVRMTKRIKGELAAYGEDCMSEEKVLNSQILIYMDGGKRMIFDIAGRDEFKNIASNIRCNSGVVMVTSNDFIRGSKIDSIHYIEKG